MPIQGLQFSIINNREAHQTYQSTGSFVVYNPNDGVAYVCTDRTATVQSFDYKVPSQSGGKFPGPINSYLSIYYLDQSGSGAGGQVIVYPSDENVNIPFFWSIGRAIQSQVTSLDVVQGTIPANPGAGIARLWVDTGGHLHVLDSTGTDRLTLDSTNYGSIISLLGDVTGLVGNTIASRASGNFNVLGMLYAGANLGALPGDITANRGNGTGGIFLGAANRYLYYDGANYQLANAGLNVGTTITSGSTITVGTNITVNGGNVYLRSDNVIRLYWDGSYVHSSHAFYADATLVSGGTIDNGGNYYYFAHNSGIYVAWNGSYLQFSHSLYLIGNTIWFGNNGSVYWSWDGTTWMTSPNNVSISGVLRCYAQICAAGGYNGANSNGFLAPNNNPGGVGLAQSWQTWASVDHAREYQLPIEPVIEPLSKVRQITGVKYDHMNFAPSETRINDTPIRREDGSLDTTPLYGFSAKDVYQVLPELVGLNPTTQEPESVDTSRMLVVLWEAVKDLEDRVNAISPA